MAALPEAYGVSLPEEYFDLMRPIDWLSFNWLALMGSEYACMSKDGFLQGLLLTALTPLAALGLVFALAVVHAIAVSRSTLKRCIPSDDQGRSTADEKDPALPLAEVGVRGFLRALPVALVALFALVPFICLRLFSTFSCVEFGFDDPDASNPESIAVTREFLRADLRYECRGAQYDTLKIVASGLLVIWFGGVPFLFWFLLKLSRRSNAVSIEVVMFSRAQLLTAIEFLYKDYTPRYYYWEVLASCALVVA